jgi:hypothetical protein
LTNITTKLESQPAAETAVHLFDNWFDPIETGMRDRVREFIHAMIEGELDLALRRFWLRRRNTIRNCVAILSPRHTSTWFN